MSPKRSLWTAIPLIALTGTALADVPNRCQEFKAIPPGSTSATLPWEQKLSFAACRLSFNVEQTPDPEKFSAVIARINAETAPSLAIYRDAAARAPTPQLRMMAQYGLGMTYVASMVRARNAISDTPESPSYLPMHNSMESWLEPYRDQAINALIQVGTIAGSSAVAASPVVSFVIADAKATANDLLSMRG